MSADKSDWTENEEISVTGTGANAKAGALLMLGPEDAILLRGVDDWDEETVGKKLSVDAIVRRRPSFPEAEDSDEAIQGTATGGETWVLEVKQYRVIE